MLKLLTSLALLFTFSTIDAQITGSKTIPGDYTTVAAAVTDLNTQGVGTGGVTFNVAAGYIETAPSGGILLTATGTAANPITFQKSGTGANPKIISTDAGTITTSIFGGQGDAIIIIQGSDYVSLNSIDLTATQSGIEYGYYLRKASGTNGCKNVSITNASITLTKGSSAYVIGIYSSNNSSSSVASSATGITVTSTSGTNENITLTGNKISNVFSGIVIIGYNASSPYTLYDQNFLVGAPDQGNTIQNFAGSATANAYGIYILYTKTVNASYNTIANSADGGIAATGTLSGIYFDNNSSGTGDYIVNNNSFTLSQGSASALSFIYNGSAITSFNANNNNFSTGSFASTADSYLIYNYSTSSSCNVNNNFTSGNINKTGAGNFTCYFQTGGGAPGGVANCSGNNFSNISITGYYNFTGINYTNISSPIYTISNNTISNIVGNGTNTMTGLNAIYGNNNSVVSGNIIDGLSGAYTIYGLIKNIDVNQQPINIFGNIISNLTALDLVYGMQFNGGSSINVYKNKVYDLSATSNTGTVYGMSFGAGNTSTISVYNNFIGNLNTPTVNSLTDAIRGINVGSFISNTNFNVYYNTVYINTTSTGANFSTSAIYHTINSNPTVGVLNLRNNILINTSTAKGAGTTVVLRRSGSSLNNYSSTSNNNLFYAGTPSPSNLIYSDGLNTSQTLSDFKTYTTPRESASVSDLPAFISTTGSSANYLHIAPNASTQANNGAVAITGITDDYDGQVRSTTTPDIGADEFDIAFLPIKFEYIKGNRSGSNNTLIWKITCTSTSVTMLLERGSDARSFDHVVTSIIASQARCGQPFNATDAAPFNGTNYYRLKMVDVDGKISYSPTIGLLNGRAGVELLGIYPTLVQDQATLNVTASRNTKMQINITDINGKVLRTINQSVSSGSSLVSVNTGNLASGVYNITGLLDGLHTQTLRFVKQ